ncbi:MAG TPA: PKD domain-containing protein, partial [Thermoplasmata archaeon]|nr:PKD domain-containing protein [Thermoplasmata archaeon]
TNAAIYGGPYFPAWRGDLFMGDCNFRRLHRLHLVPPAYDTVASDDILLTAPNAILDVEVGPDGAIWLTTPTTIYRYVDVSVPPTASFTATPNPADVGAPVAFDASASNDPDGTIVSYSWDFGDTASGTGVTTSHAYAAPGTYRVVLTVVDNESYAGNMTTDLVVRSPPVPQPPVASFTATPARANPGDPVAFDASASYDPDGSIVSYSWDFGDAASGTGVTPSHAYAAPGLYTVALTVVDNASLSGTATRAVRVNAAPVPAFTVSPATAYIGVVVTFDASASTDPNGDPLTFAWDFGDSATAAGAIATHAYAAKGRFTVTLTVSDDLGATGQDSGAVDVGNRAPVITATDPSAAAVTLAPGQARTFSVTAADPDGDVLAYVWRVNGVVVGGNATSIPFNESAVATYTVSVTVTDGLLSDSATWDVAVEPGTGPPRPEGLPGVLWWAAGLVLLAALAVAILLVVWRRRRKEPAAPPPPPP